ncbi:hypothetical protein [Gracilimonas sp.]|uniref:hypothetical protein n=1 Tax=Gracilimonas sp. TaxID=1974203 RepID=UPI0032ECD5AE
METKQVVDYLHSLERNIKLANYEVSGFNAWPIVRVFLGLNLDNFTIASGGNENASRVTRLWSKIYGFVSSIFDFIKFVSGKYSVSRSNKDIVFITYGAAQKKIGSKELDIYMSPIIENLKHDKKHLTFLYSTRQALANNKNEFVSIDAVFRAIRLKSILKSKLVSMPTELKTELKEIISKMDQDGINHSLSLKKIWFRITFIRLLADWFKEVLEKTTPTHVFGSNYYGLEMAINLAADELNITSVDVQHGVQGENHFAYTEWQNIPRNGYELLPDIFLAWDENSKEVIQSWAGKTRKHRAVVGGNVTIISNLNNSDGINDVAKLKSDCKNILITLQPGRQTLNFYKKLIDKGDSKLCWWVRLHPNMLNQLEEIRRFFEDHSYKENIFIEEATNNSLYDILMHIDLHLTETSSVILDAKYCDIKSISIHKSANSLFRKEVENGFLQYAEDEETCIEIIKKETKRREKKAAVYLLDKHTSLLRNFLLSEDLA